MSNISRRIMYIGAFIMIMVSLCMAIYEEEAGLNEWSIKSIGKVERIVPITDTHGSHLLVQSSTSDSLNIISLLNSETGNLVWRQILPKQETTFQSIQLKKSLAFVTVSGGNVVRYWSRDGTVMWTTKISTSQVCTDVSFVEDTVRVYCGDGVAPIRISNGNILPIQGQIDKKSKTPIITSEKDTFISYDKDSIYIDHVQNENSKVDTIKVITAESGDSLQARHLVLADGTVVLVSSKGQLYYGTPKSLKSVDVALLLSVKSIELISVYSNNLVLVKADNKVYKLLRVEQDKVEVVDQTIKGSDLVTSESNVKSGVLMTVDTKQVGKDKTVSITSYSQSNIKEIKTQNNIDANGMIQKIFIVNGAYLLLVNQDWSTAYYKIESNNSLQLKWSREDGLGFIVQSEMIDPPPSDISKLTELEYEFKDANGQIEGGKKELLSILSQLQRRIVGQISSVFGSTKESTSEKDKSTLQQQQQEKTKSMIDKILVVVSGTGKIYGLSLSERGQVLWSFMLPSFDTAGKQSVRTLIYNNQHPNIEIVVIYSMKDEFGVHQRISFVDPVKGKELNSKVVQSPILHAAIIPHSFAPIDASSSNILMTVLDYPAGQPPMVQLHPWTPELRKGWDKLKQEVSFYLVNTSSSQIKGYAIESMADGRHGSFKSVEIWNVNFGQSSQKIVSVGHSLVDEVIGSPAIILGNRNLLPKYLNRNLISVACHDSKGSLLNMYLLDSVTGTIIKQFIHVHSGSHVSIVHLENSIIYSHFDIQVHKQMLTSIDLFEKNIEWKKETFSSYDNPIESIKISQKSWVFPHHIQTLSLSLSSKGITSKAVLVGLTSGQILPIDKKWVDSRRPYPSEATPYDQEEGLIPYHSLLNFPPFMYVTVNNSIPELKSIKTQGTSLESTSVMMAYGLDLFCSRITPSGAYDILSGSFDHFALIGTSLLLVIFTYITSSMKKKKNLNRKWK